MHEGFPVSQKAVTSAPAFTESSHVSALFEATRLVKLRFGYNLLLESETLLGLCY
jgi:hypothetical protein